MKKIFKKAANIALAYIILSLISFPIMIMILVFSFLPALHASHGGTTQLNGLLINNIVVGTLFILAIGITNFVLLIITMVNGFRIEDKIGAILCLVGLFVFPILVWIGAILIYIGLKKKVNSLEQENNEQFEQKRNYI
ncbi:hypothetical protein ACJA25_00450 [Mycoplasmopsis hyopharyngis]|uniref:hypothetical protein n=1 Tax=Mycoplasmopsis hyopharyngis TaxID=29558 RepID=UPI003872BBEF